MFDPLTTLQNVALTVFLVLAIYLAIAWARNKLFEWIEVLDRRIGGHCKFCDSPTQPYDACWGCGYSFCRACRLKTGDVELVEGHGLEDHKRVRG